MPSLWLEHSQAPAIIATPSQNEQFARILVGLTRKVWHPDCSFESAIGAISEAAASGLKADRVSIWQYEPGHNLLRCLSAFNAVAGKHEGEESTSESLPLEGGDYIEALKLMRTCNASDAEDIRAPESIAVALRGYLRRHRIRSLLDAPAIVAGELHAVISHESIDRRREWTAEETTFAATMGDFVAMAYEIARRRAADREIEHLRLHDAQTGLPNRDYLLELASQRLETPGRGVIAVAVVHVRLDSFSSIATAAGGPTSEDMMTVLARRMRQLVHSDAELARVRSDGLAFLVSERSGKRGVVQLAERALAVVQAMEWDAALVTPNAAVGIAFAEPGIDARVLLRQAEEAAEHARGGDKFRYEVYEAVHHDLLVAGLREERELRDAFHAGEFEVHYQPEYDAGTGQWVAAEALLRRRVQGRLASAAEFIALAESSGLILPLGSWVLHQACREAAAWPPSANGSEALVRINVSARQFDEGDLVDDVRDALEQSGLAPQRLSLEITETTLMRNIEQAKDLLGQLKRIGVGVAIDDFGTGYASLTYLKQLPIDVLKIDRSFVSCLPGSVVDAAIVQAVVGLANSLRIDVIAEGVELEEQEAALMGMGVRRMQGWRYGKSMPQDDWCRALAAPCPLPGPDTA